MPLFSNKFRQNISNLRKEKSNCSFIYSLLTYLEHPSITPLGFYIFLDNLEVKNPISIKKFSLVILSELGFAALQHQVSLQHNLEDLEKLGILLHIQTVEYKLHLKQCVKKFDFHTFSIADKIRLKQEFEQLLKKTNAK